VLAGATAPIVLEPLPVDDPKVRQPDISAARSKLGWEPTTKIETGLKATFEDFRRRVVP
jgi:nucleoside-diphosphate-sugar epimerase